MLAGSLTDRSDRPAIVRFERKVVEDRQASLAAGQYVGKEIDYALVTPPYSKDVIVIKIAQWRANMDQDMRAGRIPEDWVKSYNESYEKWKNGQEMPPNGTPIRGWGIIGAAQQENLVRMNILTVEDLACANDEGKRRIGMGALDLVNKAKAWLAQIQDKGPLTMKMAALEAEKARQDKEIDALKEQVARLTATHDRAVAQEATQDVLSLSADDILPVEKAIKRR